VEGDLGGVSRGGGLMVKGELVLVEGDLGAKELWARSEKDFSRFI
jgi:hypothetical protein